MFCAAAVATMFEAKTKAFPERPAVVPLMPSDIAANSFRPDPCSSHHSKQPAPGGDGAGDGPGNGGDDETCAPQSAQSVPTSQPAYSEPGPPSSQSPSPAHEHTLEQIEPGGATIGGLTAAGGEEMDSVTYRVPQSAQSVPTAHSAY